MNQTPCGVTAAWIARRDAKGWYMPMVGDRWRRLAGELNAGFMGLEGCTNVGSRGTGILWWCPLTRGTTQGGIGAAHGPQEKPCRGTRVSPDLRTNPGRYRGHSRARGENLWGYRGVPSPQGQPREVWGPPTGPGSKSVGVLGCPVTPRTTHGRIGVSL